MAEVMFHVWRVSSVFITTVAPVADLHGPWPSAVGPTVCVPQLLPCILYNFYYEPVLQMDFSTDINFEHVTQGPSFISLNCVL